MNFKKHLPNIIFLLVLLLGLFLRTVRFEQLAGFDFDQETAALWVDDLISQHHFSLIGQETSVPGVFVAPLFYYLLTPFYLLTAGDPIAGIILVTLVSFGTMVALYFAGKEIFNQKIALLGLFLYAVSFRLNFYDRTVAPSNLVMLLSLILFYSLWKIRLGHSAWLLSMFIVFGLGLSIHPSILLYSPLCLFLTWRSPKKVSAFYWFGGFTIMAIFASPLILFEVRHGFTLSQSVINVISTPGNQIEAFLFRLGNNWETILRGLEDGFLTLTLGGLGIFALFFFSLTKKAHISVQEKLFFLWVLWPLVILSIYPRGVPEYYFLPILSLSTLFLVNWLWQIVKGKTQTVKFLVLFIPTVLNISVFAHYNYPLALFYKKQAVDYIDSSVGSRQVSIQYSTDKGQKNGFTYLLKWRRINQLPSSPERYRIVVPSNLVSAPGKIFGSIKVIKE